LTEEKRKMRRKRMEMVRKNWIRMKKGIIRRKEEKKKARAKRKMEEKEDDEEKEIMK
jgi:hypothetical protein